jgi:hypothetical protein
MNVADESNNQLSQMNIIDFVNQLFCILTLVYSLRILAIQIADDKIQMAKQENVRQKWRDMVKHVILKNQTETEPRDKWLCENHSGPHSNWDAVFMTTIHNPIMDLVRIPLRIAFPRYGNYSV